MREGRRDRRGAGRYAELAKIASTWRATVFGLIVRIEAIAPERHSHEEEVSDGEDS